MNQQIFSIDFQNDFTDPNGALYVKGAEEDAKRMAKFIRKMGDSIDDITLTLDCHRTISIFHPIWWVDEKGNNVPPFTMITEADVVGRNPKWKAKNPSWQHRSVDYVKALAIKNAPALIIWPFHCLLGSWGNGVYPELLTAVSEWETKYFGMADFTIKGSNPFCESYGIFESEVPDADDTTTQLNTGLVQKLQKADTIFINGEALSHCVSTSVRQCAREFGDEHVKKFVLLEDASSPVVSPDPALTDIFSNMADSFVKELVAKGMRIAKTTDF